METKVLLPQYLNEAQLDFIKQKTPDKFIKSRIGAGGKSFDYVEVGYVIRVLNGVFGYDWDFEIEKEDIGQKQIWVRGKLTVKTGDRIIIKSQYGGSSIKVAKFGGEVIDISNDLKSAASDALKKCASMIGIASDVYYPHITNE